MSDRRSRSIALVLRQHWQRQALRQVFPLALAVGFVILFYDRIAHLQIGDVFESFRAVSLRQWALAVAATAASFWAVGRYDAVLHRALGTGIDTKSARRAGIAGIAVSQTLGFGLLTGALVRWRLLPALSFWQATRLSLAVALSFLAGWAVVTGFTVTLLPVALGHAPVIALLPLAGLGGVVVLSLLQPRIRLFGRRVSWPTLPAIGAIVTLCAFDTLTAAAALHALLPAGAGLDFATLYPAFLLALGAALISGTPGGVGPFEVALLALLPQVPAAPLVGSILAFRAVYYALPAILGALVLARGAVRDWPSVRQPRLTPVTPAQAPSPAQARLIAAAPRAEAHLLRQGGKAVLSQSDGPARLLVAETGQALIALRDPLAGRDAGAALETLRLAARNRLRLPCLYKCSARMAVAARKAGYVTVQVAEEAVIDPCRFTPATPGRRQLRRKLARARAGGVSVLGTNGPLPLADMADISRDWAARHGGERGFSMGRFTPGYVMGQRVYLAYAGGRLQAFVTFNVNAAEWSLDLMRQRADAPDGTMYALVARAIAEAQDAGATRLTLAAVPCEPAGAGPLARWLRHRFDAAAGGAGLRQFKSAFGPRWEPLYAAAPSLPALVLAGNDIARAITRPGALPAPAPRPDPADGPALAHHHYDE